MASLIQIGVIILLGILALTYYPNLTLIVLGILLLLWLIRMGADLYWWCKDKGHL